MESIRAAMAAVKYSVVNQEKLAGLLRATPVKRMVHRGNKVVETLAVLTYASKIFLPRPSPWISSLSFSASSESLSAISSFRFSASSGSSAAA